MESGSPNLRVSRGDISFDVVIPIMHARMIALLAEIGSGYCAAEPAHTAVVHARLMRSIEGALQRTPSAHRMWLALCEEPTQPIHVEIRLNSELVSMSSDGAGNGGDGAFPGGGGGGGGGADKVGVGGRGGKGGDGFMMLFLLAADGSLVDVDVFASPGGGTWICPEGVVQAKVVGCGGGGGGGRPLQHTSTMMRGLNADAVLVDRWVTCPFSHWADSAYCHNPTSYPVTLPMIPMAHPVAGAIRVFRSAL